MPSGQEVTCFSGLGGGFDGNFVPFIGVPLKGSVRATIRDRKGYYTIGAKIIACTILWGSVSFTDRVHAIAAVVLG